MNRLLLPVLCVALGACTNTQRPVRPKPNPVSAPTSIGTIKLAGGSALLVGGAGATLGYVVHGGAWADGEAPPRPVVAVVERDAKGSVWMLHRRHGARVRGATALDVAPRGAYIRPAVATGKTTGDSYEGHFPTGTTDEDRFVIVRAGPGAPSTRVVGHLRQSGAARTAYLRDTSSGPATLVRVGANAPAIDSAPLEVELGTECPPEFGDDLRVRLTTLSVGPIAWGAPMHRVTCTPDGYTIESGARIVRTPFWAPRSLTVTKAADVVALLAALRGQLDRALVALEKDADPRVRAALAIEAGWLLDVPAVLGDAATPATHLLRAGAAYELGDHAAALAALDAAGWDGASGEVTWRRHLARAATLLAAGDTRGAITGLSAAADAEQDPQSKRSLLLGLAEVHLATGNFEPFVAALSASRGDSGAGETEATPAQEALTTRYTGLVYQSQGKLDDAIELYTSAAATYLDSGDLRQAAQSLLRVAELKVIAQRDATGELTTAHELAIKAHDDELLGQVLLDDLTRFAEKNAAVDAPPGGQDRLDAAVSANLRADRLDRVAIARRYGLLLLPSASDLSAKKASVTSALDAALCAPDLQEVSLLLSLLAQLEAAGFSFDAANRDIDLAIAFARAMEDQDLVRVLESEKATFQ